MVPMRNNSCRSAERKARLAIQDVANAENCSDEARLRALTRLAELIAGCASEIQSRQPPPSKTDPKPFEEIYI
jgi:hypothetical protein